MTMTTLTSTANFEGLSPVLKEQSTEIKYLGVVTYPIATYFKILNGVWLPQAQIVCLLSRCLGGHANFEFFNQISS